MASEAKYEGGAILDAKTGYYQEPCVVLDFASLYPSIMMAHNLCYSTIIPSYKLKDLSEKDYEKSPNGDAFIKSHVQKGILPLILEELVKKRAAVKQTLLECTDPIEQKILDNRQ